MNVTIYDIECYIYNNTSIRKLIKFLRLQTTLRQTLQKNSQDAHEIMVRCAASYTLEGT